MLVIVGTDKIGDFYFKTALEERGVPVEVVPSFDELDSFDSKERIVVIIVHFFLNGTDGDGIGDFRTSMPALRRFTTQNPWIKKGVFVDSGVCIPGVIDFSINTIPLCEQGYTRDEREEHFMNSLTCIMEEILFDAR